MHILCFFDDAICVQIRLFRARPPFRYVEHRLSQLFKYLPCNMVRVAEIIFEVFDCFQNDRKNLTLTVVEPIAILGA